MAENEEPKMSVNPGYVLGQLSRAISSATEHSDPLVRQRATERMKRWEQVFRAMLSGSISFGARAPVQGVPEWVTLEVLHGGFASGILLAAGPLQPHEIGLLEHLDLPRDDRGRAALNIYYLSEAGHSDLCRMLESGCYRINVPEEGALLVVVWLLSHRMPEKAQQLLDLLTPLFDRLRFYPAPDTSPIIPSPMVHRHTVGQTATALRERRPQHHVEQMMEALRIWEPLYDRTVSLLLETVEDDQPCQQYPSGWQGRAQSLLLEYASLRKVHKLCDKPDRPKENFCRLRGYLKKCVDNPLEISPRDVGTIRHILRCYVDSHGFPGSPEFLRRREVQTRNAAVPTHVELTRVLLNRLQEFPGDGGIGNITPVIAPVEEKESVQCGVPAGSNFPGHLAFKVRRCWDAPIEQLVNSGVIPSGEVLAQVLPQITSQAQAAAIADPNLRQLYGAIYSAFRRRRSLLLLNLERQVRFEDLPWIEAVNESRRQDLSAKDEAQQVLTDVTALTIVSFPHAILPNKLLQELRTLAKTAGITIPIVDELAADIFMGTFTDKFLSAAQIAAKTPHGSLYERYYGLPYERVLRLNDLHKTHGAKTSPGFAALCEELAQVKNDERWSVSRNGRIIEQSQVLTTQNLAPLFDSLKLVPMLSGRIRALSEQCFHWICKRQVSSSWKANLRMVKNSAYAWRQMLFFLSFLDAETTLSFVKWARTEAARQSLPFGPRLGPALSGLELVVNGNTFDQQGTAGASGGEARRFLGWTTGQHWLLGPGSREARRSP
jgi:hypothetical protein